jgi:hypothetical protein
MRKILGALSMSSALMFTLAVHAAAPADFAGTWNLDKSKSQGLSQRIQGADSVSWTIAQDGKTITIEEKITGGQMGGGPGGGGPPAGAPPAGAPPAGGPPPGGGGGGGRGGMMGGMGGPRSFNLDGSETAGDTGRGKFVRKATLSSDGKTLELVSKSTFQGQDGAEIVSTTTEKISVSADGKTLTVVRKVEGPRPSDSTLVFTK